MLRFIAKVLLVGVVLTLGLSSDSAQAGPYSDAVSASLPSAYWRMTETTGTTAADEVSPPGQNGTLINTTNAATVGPQPPTWVGFSGTNSATGFNGSNNAINTPVHLNSSPAFTMEGWVRPTGAQGNRTGLFGDNDSIEFGWINNNTLQLWTPTTGALNVAYQANSAGVLDEWHHIVALGTGAQKQLWIDGVLAGTQNHGALGAAGYGNAGGDSFNIGGDGIFDGGGNWFLGDIDEVALFGRALSQSEIAAHFLAAQTEPAPVPEPASIAIWSILGLCLAGYGYRRRRKS